MLKYKNSFGDTDVYASYLFADNDYWPGNGLRYRRQGGGSLGVNYHITPALTWGTAWIYTHATMCNPGNGDNKAYSQHIVGSALSWKPGNRTFSAGGGW